MDEFEARRSLREVQRERRSNLITGWSYLILCPVGIIVSVVGIGYLLWAHSLSWVGYSVCLITLYGMVMLLRYAPGYVRRGHQPITTDAIQQATKNYRRTLYRATLGDLPITFSRGSRIFRAVMVALLAFLVYLGWWEEAHNPSSDTLWWSIGLTVLLAYFALTLALSFTGKAYQKASATELHHIHQVGEFTAQPDDTN